jgi:hypothetical protein
VKQGSQVTAATAATLLSITAQSLKQAVQAAVQVALVPTQQILQHCSSRFPACAKSLRRTPKHRSYTPKF